MGVDFGAIYNVSLDWLALKDVAARLDLITPELAADFGYNPGGPAQWTVELEAWNYFVADAEYVADEQTECRLQAGLTGPVFTSLVPHRGFTRIGNPARFKFFLSHPNTHDGLRRSCKLIGKVIGATQVAYVADLAFGEITERRLNDEPYERVIAHFQKVWGDPSSLTPTYPIGERYWERYFVEPV